MENCLEESPHGSQDYYPHYNLFQSSIFYDTDNFRVSYLSYNHGDCLPSESSANEERSAEPPDKPPEPPEPEAPPVTTTRVITKEDLYRDPDLFKSKFDDGQTTSNGINSSHPGGYDWTKQSWVKEGAPVVDTHDEDPTGHGVHPDTGPRVTSSKAESMMQKMGWQGGALGKMGVGITHPITPETVYAFRSIGFGQRTTPPAKPQPQSPAKPPKRASSAQNKRDAFRTNVLLHILEFVQDDTETELLFDPSLRQYERRHITHLVNTVVNECQVHVLGSASQYQLGADIHRHNRYLLETERRDGDTRQLCIYKEPPDDVYLVTPEDFLPKDDITESDKIEYDKGTSESKIVENCMELDDDENPFLKSIKKSIKKDEEPVITDKFETDCTIAKDSESKDEVCKVESPASAAEKMIEFFLEFTETESFKELRFLGKFSDEQLAAVNALLDDVALWSLSSGYEDGETDIARACRLAGCELREGVNGTTEIHKTPAKSRAKV